MTNLKNRELIDKYYNMFAGGCEFCAVLDLDFTVLKSSDERLFALNENMAKHFCENVYVPIKQCSSVSVLKHEQKYSGRLYPIDEFIVCELFSAADLNRLAVHTDMAAGIMPLYSITESNAAAMWSLLEQLRADLLKNGETKKLSLVSELESKLAGISSVSRNVYEYCEMCFKEQTPVRIDAAALCRYLIDRCNAALSKCGRHVELITDPEDMHIMADSRRAVTALVNAIQNSLLYSPRDSVPLVTVYLTEINDRRYVEISVINENIMFTKADFSSGVDVNFNYQRAGYGIPIIKKFTEDCRGKFTITDENGKKRIRLTLPCASERYGTVVRLENKTFTEYKTGVPDILEIKMRETADFFGEIDS